MTLDEVLATVPEVRPLDDERARFYLENRLLIETWAVLREDAGDAIMERVLDLRSGLSVDLERLGEEDAEAKIAQNRGRESVELARRSWSQHQHGSPVRVALETEPKRPINSRGNLQLYVCIRAKQSHPDAAAWVEPLKTLSRDLRPSLTASYGAGWTLSGPRYPLYRYVPVQGDSWEVETIIQRSREELLQLWAAAAPAIDALVVERASTTPGA